MVSGLDCEKVAATGGNEVATTGSGFCCGWLIAAFVAGVVAGCGCSAGGKAVARVAEVEAVVLILLEADVVVVVADVDFDLKPELKSKLELEKPVGKDGKRNTEE